MDEEKLRASCGADSFYISLQDQKDADKMIPRPAGPTVSREQTTHLHLAVRHHQHWAAVQICVSPFNIAAIPEQKFLQCCLRHTWCCERAVGECVEQEPWKSVQRIYDLYYGPTWNFSSEYCRSTDPPSSIPHPNRLTCEKRAEHALTTYIQRGKENLSEDSNLAVVHNEVANQLKRTSNDHNHDIDYDDDIRDGNLVGASSTGTKRRRLRASSDLIKGRSSSRNGEDNCTGNTVQVQSKEFQAAEIRSGVKPSVQLLTEEISVKLAKKIRSGLDGMRRKEENPKKRSKPRRIAPNDTAIDGIIDKVQLNPNGNIPTADQVDIGIDDRLSNLETFLLEQSSSATKRARETVWKCKFLAACVRRIRNHDLSSKVDGSKATRVRWINAAWIVNSVVEGLWCKWGPRAALIYDALASENYCLNHVSQLAVSTMQSVIDCVVLKLQAVPPPPLSLRAHVFHPAAYISSATNTKYVEALMMLMLDFIADKLCEYSYVSICNSLALSSFSKLSCAGNLHSELPLLIDQWNQYEAATLPGSGPQGFSEQGALTKFDALADVAVAEIGRNTTLAIEPQVRVGAAKCMETVSRDRDLHTSSQTALQSVNLETEARGLGAEDQHRAGPSSEATFNENRPQATTNCYISVADGAMTDCMDPCLTNLLHSSGYLPSIEQSPRDGAMCPSMLTIDPFITDYLEMSESLPDTLGPGSSEEAIDLTTRTMDPSLTSSLHKSDHLPSALDTNSDQGAAGPTTVVVDPYLTDSLYTSNYLPNAVEPSSDQGASCSSTLVIDPYLTGSLYASGYLPSAVEPSSIQGESCPSTPMIDPYTTSSPHMSDSLPSSLEPNNGCLGEASTGPDHYEHETQTHATIMV